MWVSHSCSCVNRLKNLWGCINVWGRNTHVAQYVDSGSASSVFLSSPHPLHRMESISTEGSHLNILQCCEKVSYYLQMEKTWNIGDPSQEWQTTKFFQERFNNSSRRSQKNSEEHLKNDYSIWKNGKKLDLWDIYKVQTTGDQKKQNNTPRLVSHLPKKYLNDPQEFWIIFCGLMTQK